MITILSHQTRQIFQPMKYGWLLPEPVTAARFPKACFVPAIAGPEQRDGLVFAIGLEAMRINRIAVSVVLVQSLLPSLTILFWLVRSCGDYSKVFVSGLSALGEVIWP